MEGPGGRPLQDHHEGGPGLHAGQGPGATIVLQDLSDTGNRDMQTSYSATFDKDAPNFGLLPPLDGEAARGRDRKKAMARRALADLDAWLGRRAAAE